MSTINSIVSPMSIPLLTLLTFLFLAWSSFFKGIGVLYAVYYAALIGYDAWLSNSRIHRIGQTRHRGESEYEIHMPQITVPETKPVRVTLPAAVDEPALMPFETVNSINSVNSVNSEILTAESDAAPLFPFVPTVEEHSVSVSEFKENHQRNLAKGLKAFS